MDYSDYSDNSPTSFVSWATNVTKCSNPVFENVLRRNWSNSSMQQDVLTVLTGITKLIHDKDGKESGAEYYAALLTALNTPSTTKSAEAYLLKLIISKAIPDSLLRATFSEASKIIINILSSSPPDNPATPPMLKSLLVCLGRLLRAQSRDAWSTESVRHIYRYILRFVDHEKPAVRKASHTAVLDILVGNSEVENDPSILFHPACHQTQDHLCSSLRRESRQLISVLHTKESHCTRLLHCLELLASVLHVMPLKDVKTSCECILELTEFPNPLVVSKSFDSIRTLFENQPSTSCLSIELTARLLTALYAARPNDPAIFTTPTVTSQSGQPNSFTGLEVLIAWVRCVRAGCFYLCSLCNTAVQSEVPANQTITGSVSVSRLLGEHLDRLIKTLIEILTSTPLPKLRKLISVILDEVLMNELDNQLVTGDFQNTFSALLPSIARQLKECLNLSRSEVWPHALVLSARLLRIWPQHGKTLLVSDLDPNLCELLRHVVQLRDALVDGPASLCNLISNDLLHGNSVPQLANLNEDLGNAVVDELDRVCLVALETLGPDLVLTEGLIPLEPIITELESGSVDLRRSWILPLLVRVIPKTPCRLNFFTKHLLPLADRALAVAKATVSKMASKEEKGSSGGAALITAGITVTRQIWAALAMFVRKAPEDWCELSTGGFGRRLVKELANTSALRPTILMTFRRLSLAAQKSEAGLVAMRGGAKLAIPTMLSLYENADPSTHSALQQQIRATLAAYFPCLTNKMIASPATLAYEKLTSTQNPVYMEILQMVVPHTSAEEIATFLTKLTPYLSSASCASRVLQKRAYRLLELICSGTTESTQMYLTGNLDALLDLLYVLNNPPPHTESVPKTVVDPKPNLPTDEISDQLASLSFTGLSTPGKKKKKGRATVPWKPRLRCIYHLLCHLVAQEQSAREASDNNTQAEGSNEAIRSTRLRNFANMFLPEILAAVCEVNRIVRDLAGRLLINLVMAFAGRTPISAASLPGGQSATAILDTKTVRSCITDRALSSDDSDVDAKSEKETSSISGFTCADEDEIRSTLSMPRGGPQSVQVCHALNLVISRLWGCLPPHVPLATNPSELAMQESAGRVVCHLLRHLRFRRALVFTLGSADDELGAKIASAILSEAAVAAQHLTAAPHRELARVGLQLIRLLIAFVNYGAVGLVELVQSLQGLHKTQKRPLRFGVKAILEKMIKKFGRKTIQGMTNAEYQKVVRNSARIMARRERQSSSELEQIRKDSDLSVAGAGSVRSKAGTLVSERASTKSLGAMSMHSHASLPPRVHMPRFGELLAQSSDEDDDGARSRRSAPSVRSTVSSKRSQLKEAQPKSLVEELESMAETSGLCRRARKRALGRHAGADSDSDDSDQADDRSNTLLNPGRRVRFADTTSLASTNRLTAKRSRRTGATESSDLWLVEDDPDTGDVLDLSDPKALARHTAFASDAETAKAMTNAFRAAAAARSHTRSTTSTPFPVVNGRIVIDDSSNTKSQELANEDWSLYGSDDDEADAAGPSSGWAHQPSGATRSSKPSKVHIPGREYASSKALGDMRRPGQPDPYAYISLGAGLGASSRKTTTAQERRRLLKAVGMGRKKRKHLEKAGLESSVPKARKARLRAASKMTRQATGGRGIRRKLSVDH